ncbi:hypothetical protein HYX19_02750 [Candidatus Woesearchaeota archaeon]|nr:hypothetical protein [Candidatus Woesearchaeota archaeon]
MAEDIKRNFEFLYFGRGRHICPNNKILDRPLEIIKELGGEAVIEIDESGSDHYEGYWRGFSFDFRVFKFSGYSLKACFTREERPDHPENPMYVTRIRLGNYDLEKRDEEALTKILSAALSKLPTSDSP